MAAEDREHKFEITEKLIAKSSSFSFAQAFIASCFFKPEK
jgi:hypothetical protein